MKKTGPRLDWCVDRLGKDENWWVESISDKENWDVEDLGIIDPKQFLHINELIDSMTEFGLDSQLIDEAFFTFEIAEEVKGGMIKLVRADFLNHISSVRVSMLNELIEFTDPYTQEEMEEVLAEKENNDFLEAKRSHFSEELLSILEFVPEGFAIDSDLEEDNENSSKKEEDYSDLETGLVEVSDKEEKLLPDEDLKWEEEEREETTPYEGGAPDEDQ